MLVYIHVKRELVEAAAPLATIVGDVNRIVGERQAVVLADGQFLRSPVSLDWNVDTYFTEDSTTPFDHPLREWGEAQRTYFINLWGIAQPYQYGEDPEPYDRFCIGAWVPGPYLESGEHILGLLHADQDKRYLYCTCHSAEIVYTSRHRVLCASCGCLHCVLSKPLGRKFERQYSESEWRASVDDEGEVIDDSFSIDIVDYREIKEGGLIWETDAWSEATGLIEFYATASPEEIEKYEAGLATVEDFVEAGFSRAPTVPPLVAQLSTAGVQIDIAENAAAALKMGVGGFADSRTDPSTLRNAVLNIFQALELILKIRLAELDPARDPRKLNISSVLKALGTNNVSVSPEDAEAIDKLRKLRNRLQHDGVALSYSGVRGLLRRVLCFLDNFTLEQLGWWIGEIVERSGWAAMLQLESVRSNAQHQAKLRTESARAVPGAEITRCTNCSSETFVRMPGMLPECFYCRFQPFEEKVRSRG